MQDYQHFPLTLEIWINYVFWYYNQHKKQPALMCTIYKDKNLPPNVLQAVRICQMSQLYSIKNNIQVTVDSVEESSSTSDSPPNTHAQLSSSLDTNQERLDSVLFIITIISSFQSPCIFQSTQTSLALIHWHLSDHEMQILHITCRTPYYHKASKRKGICGRTA